MCHTDPSLGVKELMPPNAGSAADRYFLVVNCLRILPQLKRAIQAKTILLVQGNILITAGGIKAQPFVPLWDNSERLSQLWSWDCITAQLLRLPNSAFFFSLPYILIPRGIPNKPPAC